MRIVLMGPPGAGKGTQAKRLVEKFDMAHLSSGDIFRAEKASGSQLGREMAGYMDAGKLVPDDIVVRIMAKAVTEATAPGGLLLDGFPRTVAQAEALDRQLDKAGAALDAVIVIEAGDELIVERICGRRSCPKCGRIYHVKFMPPKTKGICDDCGVKLVQRQDDTEAVIRQRLETYRKQTEPVIAYYRKAGRTDVMVINGDKPLEDVTASMIAGVESAAGRN